MSECQRTKDERLSFAAQQALQRMVAAEDGEDFEDAELVQEGLQAWIGCWRTSPSVVLELLRACLLRDVGEDKGVHRYMVNEDGRKAAFDPYWRPPEMRGLTR